MRTLIALAGTDAAAGLQPGPRVYLNYTQAELDAAYDQAAYHAAHPAIARPLAQQQRAHPRPHRPAVAPRLRPERDRAARHLPHRRARRGAGLRLHPRRRVAGRLGEPVFGARRRCSSAPGRITSRRISSTVQDAGGSLFPMAEQVCRAIAWVYRNAAEFRRRPATDLCRRPFVGRASRRGGADRRLEARVRPAARRHQGRAVRQRHVRSVPGEPVAPLVIRELHRRDGRNAQPAAPYRAAAMRRSSSPTAPTRRPSSSARRATSPPRCATPASRSN